MIESHIVRGIKWDCQVQDALGFRRIATRKKRYGDTVCPTAENSAKIMANSATARHFPLSESSSSSAEWIRNAPSGVRSLESSRDRR